MATLEEIRRARQLDAIRQARARDTQATVTRDPAQEADIRQAFTQSFPSRGPAGMSVRTAEQAAPAQQPYPLG